MDGDAVSEAPSDGNKEEAGPTTYTEMFIKVFPKYLAMGMTYEQFWNGPAWLTHAYREAYRDKLRNEEWSRWRQGAYFYDAMLCVAPIMRAFGKGKVEPGKYPNRPWPLTEKEAREQEAEEKRQRFERFMAMLNKESEEAIKKQREEAKANDEKVVSGDA